jgi:hypothetical protein
VTTSEQIARLVSESEERDPRAAVRARARALVEQFVSLFGEPEMPLDMEQLASLRGVRKGDEPPAHSPDAELVPEGDGRVVMRVNPDRPETRQRFSMGHEVVHTFFPGYAEKVQCRTDARHRDPADPDDLLEILCDAGAAELLFPLPWFARDASGVDGADGLVALADRYRASREATLRRYAELHASPVAAVFFAWKLKPTQKPTVGRENQPNLFGGSAAEERRDALRLRIDYTIGSPAFGDIGHFLPKDKSVESTGPLFEAASTGRPSDGECVLDLGQARGTYRVCAVPLWTPADQAGPRGETAVAAIIRPVAVRKPKRKGTAQQGPSLF